MLDSTPSPHPELDQLAVELFRLIARFEYALKAAGYRKREEGRAEPCWDRFAVAISDKLAQLEEPTYREASKYLLEHPPKRQMVRGGVMVWEHTAINGQPESQRLLGHVRQVRNNLFHGGKFNGQWFEPQRSGELIESSLIVLRYAVELDPDVFQAFCE